MGQLITCCRSDSSKPSNQNEISLANTSKSSQDYWYSKLLIDTAYKIPIDMLNQHENGIAIDAQWIIKFIESLYTQHEGYKLQMENDRARCYTSNGSMFTKEFCIGKIYYTLNGTLAKLYEAIFVPESRMKWDTSVIEYSIASKINECVNVIYVLRKGILLMKNRDYYIKRIIFYSDNKIYYYCSSIPETNETPEKVENIRASTIIDAGMLSEVSGKLEYFSCMQMDAKVNISQVIVQSFLHANADSTQKKLQAFISLQS